MLPLRIVAVLLLAFWGTVVGMWLVLGPYWERTFMTEARRREKEAAKAQQRPGPRAHRAWRAVAVGVLLVLPPLLIVDALVLPLGLLYAPSLTLPLPFASAWQVAGVVLALAGLGIMLSVGRVLARDVYGRAEEERFLITSGLHARVRHPFYLHFVLVPVGLLLLTLNVLLFFVVLFYNTLDGPRSPLAIMKEEEATLLERYGEAYAAYMERTGRFLPRLRR